MDEISVDLTMANYPVYNFTQSSKLFFSIILDFIDTDIEKNINLNITSQEESERFGIDDNMILINEKFSRRSYSISESIVIIFY